ncbi:hypothetical protein V9T40_006898 [Parthenolecanium corni]|uniref:Uncharacterized protein n=1 Tax=Parthenolecanium corni TaxID=536013 RepID=A0AAN9U0I5_9HEMI
MTTTGRTHTFELVKYLHLCTALPLLAPPPPPPPPPTPPPPPRSLHSLESASSATRKFVENVKCGVCGPRTAYRHVITVSDAPTPSPSPSPSPHVFPPVIALPPAPTYEYYDARGGRYSISL